MTENSDSLPGQQDARSLQAQLYREIGIAAVAAALRFTTQPEPAPQPRAVEKPAEKPYIGETLAA